MTKLSFNVDPCLRAKQAANDHDADVSSTVQDATRPCLVTLESGIKALVKITGFTYVDGVPLALGEGVTENINAADLLECGPNGMQLKRKLAPI